jgi:hypothetical protein
MLHQQIEERKLAPEDDERLRRLCHRLALRVKADIAEEAAAKATALAEAEQTVWLVHASGDEHSYWLYPTYESARAGLVSTVTAWAADYDVELPCADAPDDAWTHVLDDCCSQGHYFYIEELPIAA